MFGKVFRIKSTASLGKHVAVEGILNIDTTLGGYLYLDGSLMSGTEIAYLDGVTAGTALASKALVLGASKEITGVGSFGITITNPSTATNGIYVATSAANTWSGSVAGVRSTLTSSATAAIGNAYGGRFELIQSGLPASQGHTAGLYAQTTVTGATNNPTSVITACLAGASGGTLTPFILFQDASTDKSTVLFSVGSAGNLMGTTSGKIYYNETLRILANASARYIPLSTAEGTFTTAYPVIIGQSAGPAAASNALYVTQTLSANWTGSQAGLRVAVDSSATGAIGNARAIMSKITMSANPSSQGHTAAGYFEAATVDASTNITGVISLVKSGDAGGGNTPFINFLDASTTKSTVLFELGTGDAVGEGTAGELFRNNVSIAATSEISKGLRCKVNGSIYYICMIAAADV